MPEFEITSVKNERIKRLSRLRDRRHRDSEGVFVVEGPRLFTRALSWGLLPLEIYTDGSLSELPAGNVTFVESSVLDGVSYRRASQGLIAVFPQFHDELPDLELSSQPVIVVADSIEKPGNLGAMARIIAAVGADAMFITGGKTDRFNPNALRASTGAVLSLPIVDADLDLVHQWLVDAAIPLVALTPDAPTAIWDDDFTGPCALLVGPEDLGIGSAALDLCDRAVSIPMTGGVVDSLNASVALGVALFEVARQRRDVPT